MAHRKCFRSLWKKISNAKLGKNEYSQPRNSMVENTDFFPILRWQFFFQRLLKHFLCATYPRLDYLEGALDLVVYVSEKHRNIGRTNPKILKEMSTKREFSKSTLKSKELNGWEYSILLNFELKSFFQRLLKNFLCATHPWLKYLEGVLNFVVDVSKKIKSIGRTNPKILNKTVRGEKSWGFFPPPFPI